MKGFAENYRINRSFYHNCLQSRKLEKMPGYIGWGLEEISTGIIPIPPNGTLCLANF
jgi:hypothetical protein